MKLKSIIIVFNALRIDGGGFVYKIWNKLIKVLDHETNRIKFFLNQFSSTEVMSFLELKKGLILVHLKIMNVR